MASTSPLGCIQAYDALIISKEGITLGGLAVTSVEWTRRLDDVSEATVKVALVGRGCAPCDVIAKIGVWHHHLVLFRDGELVWDGPIVGLNVSRTEAVITARDLFALMDKRLVHSDLCFASACGGAATDLTEIGAGLINDAFIVDGHNYTIQKFNQTGLLGERLYTPGEHSLDAFREALNLGLDATVLGRRIILGRAPFGSTALLTSEDFLVDLQFEVDGLATATKVITKGNGVIGVAKAAGSDINGVDPYFGLLEFEGNDRQELDTQALADAGAVSVLASHYPAPTTLVTPTGARLSPNAPVTIADLVPGVLIPVLANDLCLEVSGQYVLIQLDVTWDSEAGEAVQITLGTIGSVNSGESSTNA